MRFSLLLCLLTGLAIGLTTARGWFRPLEDPWIDAAFRSRPERSSPQGIAVIGITDDCLAELGQWPWPRAIHARLVDRLRTAKASVVLWDMVFSEPSRLGPEDDRALVEAMKAAGTVYMPITLASTQAVRRGGEVSLTVMPDRLEGFTSLAELNAAAAGVGHIYFPADRDGILRSVLDEFTFSGGSYPALPLLVPGPGPNLELSLRLTPGRSHLDFLGRSQSPFEILPYAAVLSGDIPDEALAGKIVLVGGTAVGLHDEHTTPLGRVFGLEVLATMTANRREGRFLHAPPAGPTAVGLVLATLLAGLLSVGLGWVPGGILCALIIGAWIGLARHMFATEALCLPLVPGIFALLAGHGIVMVRSISGALRDRQEHRRQERRIEEILDQTSRDMNAGRWLLALDRLRSLPEVTGSHRERASSMRLEALARSGDELELEELLDRKEAASCSVDSLTRTAGVLEERGCYHLAERLLETLSDRSPDADSERLERVRKLKADSGQAGPLVSLARRVLGATYSDVSMLGAGGMGFVVKAFHVQRKEWTAVKFLSPAFSQEAHFRKRFEREARILAELRHPNIVGVIEENVHHDQPWYAMDLFRGRSLAQVLEDQIPLPLDEATRVLVPVAHALDHAHARGVIHRDVKPDNILVSDDGSVKLTDFGIAKASEMTSFTVTGAVVGTPDYMAPEQLQGRIHEISPRTDVYSLGIVAYRLLTGQMPFAHGSSPSMRLMATIRPLESWGLEFPPDVIEVVRSALDPKPARRPRTCQELVEPLERAARSASS